MIMLKSNGVSSSSRDALKLDEVIVIGEGQQQEAGKKMTKFSLLHSLSPALNNNKKLSTGLVPRVIHNHKESEKMVQLTKLIKSNDTEVVVDTKNNILKGNFIPKYKPNSKVKGGSHPGSSIVMDNNKIKINHTQILRPCQSPHSDNKKSGHSCVTMTPHNPTTTTNNNNVTSKINNKTNRQNPINSNTSKGRMRKVRFDKKLTIHYVPADEERGSFEWRKNLTRQGIYQVMLWKSELEKLEL